MSHHALGDFSFLLLSCPKDGKRTRYQEISLAMMYLKPGTSIKSSVDQYKSNDEHGKPNQKQNCYICLHFIESNVLPHVDASIYPSLFLQLTSIYIYFIDKVIISSFMKTERSWPSEMPSGTSQRLVLSLKSVLHG